MRPVYPIREENFLQRRRCRIIMAVNLIGLVTTLGFVYAGISENRTGEDNVDRRDAAVYFSLAACSGAMTVASDILLCNDRCFQALSNFWNTMCCSTNRSNRSELISDDSITSNEENKINKELRQHQASFSPFEMSSPPT
jgi:hypothetical protein